MAVSEAFRSSGVSVFMPNRVRKGKTAKDKTAKDKSTGAWSNRFANRARRVEWQKDARATNASFPYGSSVPR